MKNFGKWGTCAAAFMLSCALMATVCVRPARAAVPADGEDAKLATMEEGEPKGEEDPNLPPQEDADPNLRPQEEQPSGETPGDGSGSDAENSDENLKGQETEPTEEPQNIPTPDIDYQTHVQSYGWQDPVSDGETAGTTGKAKRVEAVQISLSNPDGSAVDGGVEYSVHVQRIGWQEAKSNGQTAGTTGQAKRVEAIRVNLTGAVANAYDVWYRVHVQKIGWMAWAKNGDPAGTMGHALRVEALQMQILAKDAPAPTSADAATTDAFRDNAHVAVSAHVQKIGWQGATKSNSAIAGTTGRGLRMEAITARLDGCYESGGIEYGAHVQKVGWTGTSANGAVSGTTGRGLREEALWFKLTGDIADAYDVWYRVHVAKAGWLDWAENGEYAGTSGLSARVEAAQVRLVRKGAGAPGATDVPYVELPTLSYTTYVQGKGWQPDVAAGETSGTTGESLPIEAIKVSTTGDNPAAAGTAEYQVHAQSGDWQGWRLNGTQAGATDSDQHIEAVEARLTGVFGKLCNLWYRVHVQKVGWLGWAASGNPAGSTGLNLRVEAVQFQVRSKFVGAPGSQYQTFSTTKLGWQNPAGYPQVSSKSVVLPAYCVGPFNYVSPSTISATATREECIEAFIRRAQQYIGTRYIEPWSTAPGGAVDCSGLVLQCLYATGMDMGVYNPYNHRWQAWQTYNSMNWYHNNTFKPVSLSERRRGDVIYYSGHIAIYVGNDQIIDSWPGRGVTQRNMWFKSPIGCARPFV